MTYLYLAIGGALGTIARFSVGGWIQDLTAESFPWPTFAVNVVGSLILGAVLSYEQAASLSTDLRALIAVGFCGAFTTFSTFSYEAFALLQRGETGRAFAYLGGSVVVGLIAIVVGYAAGSSLAR